MCVPKGPIHNESTVIQVMPGHWKHDKALPEPMVTQIHDVIWCHQASMSWSIFYDIMFDGHRELCPQSLVPISQSSLYIPHHVNYFLCSRAPMFFLIKESTFMEWENTKYRKIFNIRRTKYQTLNDSHLILQLAFPNPLKPGVKLRMKM